MKLTGRDVVGLLVGPMLMVIGGQAHAQVELPTPLLQWTFEESASGEGDALDSGEAPPETGLLMGGATRTGDTPNDASRGAADLLRMGDGYIQADDSSALDGLGALTITAWVKLLEDPTADGSGNDRIAAIQGSDANFSGFSFNINDPGDGDYSKDRFRLGMFIGGDQFAFLQTGEVIEDQGDEWTFLAVSYDSDVLLDNAAFYWGTDVPEEEVTQLACTAFCDLNAGPVAVSGVNFYVGKTDAAPAANTSIEGFVDDVRLYSSMLSTEEIEAVRLEGITPPGLASDFDKDGDVDGDDFLIWQAQFGKAGDGNTGDADENGKVDGDDFLIWQAQFGTGVEPDGALSRGVPEPTSLSLMLIGWSVCWRRRRSV